jgi:hypothetical protein
MVLEQAQQDERERVHEMVAGAGLPPGEPLLAGDRLEPVRAERAQAHAEQPPERAHHRPVHDDTRSRHVRQRDPRRAASRNSVAIRGGGRQRGGGADARAATRRTYREPSAGGGSS